MQKLQKQVQVPGCPLPRRIRKRSRDIHSTKRRVVHTQKISATEEKANQEAVFRLICSIIWKHSCEIWLGMRKEETNEPPDIMDIVKAIGKTIHS